jgi:hypothetical protein
LLLISNGFEHPSITGNFSSSLFENQPSEKTEFYSGMPHLSGNLSVGFSRNRRIPFAKQTYGLTVHSRLVLVKKPFAAFARLANRITFATT